tara:strand:- start:530 stop:643 length:114 start_codon:yes stop_codon:yes gene_type:complete
LDPSKIPTDDLDDEILNRMNKEVGLKSLHRYYFSLFL